MQLKITRKMEMKGLMSKKPVFGITFRAEYSEEEREAINAYNLGGDIILVKDGGLVVTIKNLKDGHYRECPDLAAIIDLENELAQMCKNLKSYLEVAKTFDGRDVVVEF